MKISLNMRKYRELDDGYGGLGGSSVKDIPNVITKPKDYIRLELDLSFGEIVDIGSKQKSVINPTKQELIIINDIDDLMDVEDEDGSSSVMLTEILLFLAIGVCLIIGIVSLAFKIV